MLRNIQRHASKLSRSYTSTRSVADTLGDLGIQKQRSPFTMTKLVCTIGPTSEDAPTLQKVVTEGMRIMRVNFSHATVEEANNRLSRLKTSIGSHSVGEIKQPDGSVESVLNCRATLLDTKGPEIRMGAFVESLPKKVMLNKDDKVTVTVDPKYRETMTGELLFIDYPKLLSTMGLGDKILLDDGLVELTVDEINHDDGTLVCNIANGNLLGSRKGVNLPGKIVDLPALTEKDLVDLKYGIDNDMDFVAVSFVRKAQDVQTIRDHLKRLQKEAGISSDYPIPLIISKIENGEALLNFDEILKVSDGIMVARGDLGVEIPFEKVTRAQKMMVEKCREQGKPVIVATQMLESMQNNPRPTRAEVSDVTNAVLDGADAVMLSGESANGKYPVESVQTMTTIIKEADDIAKYTSKAIQFNDPSTPREANARVAVEMSKYLDAKLLIVLAETGETARLVSKHRPNVPIMAFCDSAKVARQVNIMHGVYPMVMHSKEGASNAERATDAITIARKIKWVQPGDVVVYCVTGPGDEIRGRTSGVFSCTVR